jgi:hypothetical protein
MRQTRGLRLPDGLAGVARTNHDVARVCGDWAAAAKGTTMRGVIMLWGSLASCVLILCVLASSLLPAVALPLSEFGRVYPYLVRKAQICLLTSIPTQANPVRDATTLAEVRRRLPDTFACGRCRYDLAGDLGGAYYLRTCR